MSTTPDPRPLRADARRNRERIVEAAREVFAEYGEATQVDDVARRAGVGIGTLYRHFPNKEVLIGELMRLKFERLAERAQHWLDTTAGTDPWAAFCGFVREATEAMATDAAQQRMIWEISPEAFAHAVPAQERLVAVGGELIDRARAAGALREDFSVDDMPAIMCALGSAMALQHPDGTPHDWRRLLEFLLAGLRRP